MTLLALALLTMAVLTVGYLTYGKFIARQFRLDDNATTPAVARADRRSIWRGQNLVQFNR